jgi:hypothetical protein
LEQFFEMGPLLLWVDPDTKHIVNEAAEEGKVLFVTGHTFCLFVVSAQ